MNVNLISISFVFIVFSITNGNCFKVNESPPSNLCPEGHYLRNNECFACPKNTFSQTGLRCTFCPGDSSSDAGSSYCYYESKHPYDNFSQNTSGTFQLPGVSHYQVQFFNTSIEYCPGGCDSLAIYPGAISANANSPLYIYSGGTDSKNTELIIESDSGLIVKFFSDSTINDYGYTILISPYIPPGRFGTTVSFSVEGYAATKNIKCDKNIIDIMGKAVKSVTLSVSNSSLSVEPDPSLFIKTCDDDDNDETVLLSSTLSFQVTSSDIESENQIAALRDGVYRRLKETVETSQFIALVQSYLESSNNPDYIEFSKTLSINASLIAVKSFPSNNVNPPPPITKPKKRNLRKNTDDKYSAMLYGVLPAVVVIGIACYLWYKWPFVGTASISGEIGNFEEIEQSSENAEISTTVSTKEIMTFTEGIEMDNLPDYNESTAVGSNFAYSTNASATLAYENTSMSKSPVASRQGKNQVSYFAPKSSSPLPNSKYPFGELGERPFTSKEDRKADTDRKHTEESKFHEDDTVDDDNGYEPENNIRVAITVNFPEKNLQVKKPKTFIDRLDSSRGSTGGSADNEKRIGKNMRGITYFMTPKKPKDIEVTDIEELQSGDNVEANYKALGKWNPGKISSCNHGDGSYDIKYIDGDSEIRVPEAMIRKNRGS